MNRFLPFLISLILFLPITTKGETVGRYYMELNRGSSSISGLLITKQEEGKIMGSIVNEFGVSAIDFCYDIQKRDMKLLNVVKFLDKWYIKRTLKQDLAYCICELTDLEHKPSGKYIIVTSPDSTTVINRKRDISYTFTQINPIDSHAD